MPPESIDESTSLDEQRPGPGDEVRRVSAHDADTALTPVPYYCEENIWQLCGQPLPEVTVRAALFISNAARQVVVARQRAANRPDELVMWDYHVVMAGRRPDGWAIWDFDTTLGMPVPLRAYLGASLDYPEGLRSPYGARIRVVEATEYRRVLCTDRSHMRDDSGQLRAPPPPWPTIGQDTNLMRFVDLEDPIAGTVVELSRVPQALALLET